MSEQQTRAQLIFIRTSGCEPENECSKRDESIDEHAHIASHPAKMDSKHHFLRVRTHSSVDSDQRPGVKRTKLKWHKTGNICMAAPSYAHHGYPGTGSSSLEILLFLQTGGDCSSVGLDLYE